MSRKKYQPVPYYKTRISEVIQKLELLQKKNLKFSFARLLFFLLGIALSILAFAQWDWRLGMTITTLWVILFLILIRQQIKLQQKIADLEARKIVVQNELDVLADQSNIYYDGKKYAQSNHLYAEDLDILGENSIYHKINRARTYHGNLLLSQHLLNKIDVLQIKERQEAVKEVSGIDQWREDFLSSLVNTNSLENQNKAEILEEALSMNLGTIHKPWISFLGKILPAYWLLLLVLKLLLDIAYIDSLIFFSVGILLIIYFWKAKEISQAQLAITKGADILSPYNKALDIITRHTWQSQMTKKIVSSYKIDEKGHFSSLVDLQDIIDKLDYRLNLIVGIGLNLFCLWDFRVIEKLIKWQEKNQGQVTKLFYVIGQFEVLTSLATWAYNHPDYHYAQVLTGDFYLQGKSLRHPLIPDKVSIANDFEINNEQYASIITGSNMAGKSTFLRTIGVNIVLTYAGTTSSCKTFSFTPVQIMTYMRIKDALEENVSTFKAELNRVEQMLDLINSGQPCLILIDEMLRGTNSKDKLKGSIAITQKLIENKAYVMIATHDIKLTSLKKNYPNHIKNYYFDIEFEEGELQFDYKIKEGICENFNASYLLKQIGIGA